MTGFSVDTAGMNSTNSIKQTGAADIYSLKSKAKDPRKLALKVILIGLGAIGLIGGIAAAGVMTPLMGLPYLGLLGFSVAGVVMIAIGACVKSNSRKEVNIVFIGDSSDRKDQKESFLSLSQIENPKTKSTNSLKYKKIDALVLYCKDGVDLNEAEILKSLKKMTRLKKFIVVGNRLTLPEIKRFNRINLLQKKVISALEEVSTYPMLYSLNPRSL